MKLQFLGATRQVTGSRFYLQADGARVLIDCGMFQEREFLGRNWDVSPVRPRDVTAGLLTHAHIDHCGLAPRLVHEGMRAPLLATPASVDLIELVLRDAAEIQEEDAAFKRKRHRKEGRKGAYPVEPLYTTADVERTLPYLKGVAYDCETPVANSLVARFRDAGHILGSAIIEVRFRDNGSSRTAIFSGDIGQWDKPLVRDPTTFSEADYIVMESTYGDRDHEERGSVEDQLATVIRAAFEAGGKVIIPVFAIERTQELIYHLGRLFRARRIPEMLVFLDSPMAADAIEVFARHSDCFDQQVEEMIANGDSPLTFPSLKTLRTVEESKAVNALKGPAIIMATSGMCTAGRIKHHLAQHISDPAATILFVGYQARNTLGRQILDGNPEVRIHGRSRLVRARVEKIYGFSGHADRSALMKWLAAFQRPPKKLFLVHGEEQVSVHLANEIREQFGWNVVVPEYQQVVELE